MQFLYWKLQAKAVVALHEYGRQYLHSSTDTYTTDKQQSAISSLNTHTRSIYIYECCACVSTAQGIPTTRYLPELMGDMCDCICKLKTKF